MTGALVILAAMIVVGLLLYITDVRYFRHHHSAPDSESSGQEVTEEDGKEKKEPEVCCGMHLVCEKTSLSIMSDEIVYYDDEELDRFSGRDPLSYTPEESDEFRDVLLTLLPQDIPGWAKSITLRRIELPPEVKDELIMLVSELREVS